MQIDRAVVEQALETIEGLTRDRLFTAEWAGKHGVTIAALRAALAQQAEPVEPVATVAENATTQQRVVKTPPSDYRRGYWDGFNIGKREGRIEAEDALAQQAEAVEPVATVAARQYDDGTYAGNALDWAGRNCEDDFPVGTKLYTSPPQRKPLTEKDLRKLADKHLFYQLESYEASGVFALSRAVERAHGIKE
jgi:hypothetical protein